MLAEHLQRPNNVCENSEAVGGAFQQWQQWVTSAGAEFCERGMQPLSIAGENAELMVVTMLKNSFVAENLLCQIVLLCSLYLL